MAIIPVPVMGTQGLVSDSANKFNQLLSDFFLSDANQSQLYAGKIYSLPKLLQEAGSNSSEAAQSIKNAFSAYLSKYYDVVNVSVTVTDDPAAGREDQLVLKLIASIQEDTQQAEYGYLLKSANAMIQEVVRINNYGA